MSLLGVMLCPQKREAAFGYLGFGISVIPLNGKKPLYGWERYCKARASLVEAKRWWRQNAPNQPNIGIICGAVSGNLAVLDLDGESAVASFDNAFPDLRQTLTVRTGRGLHVYYHTVDTCPTIRLLGESGNFELRSNGLYVVAPPSIHPDTKHPYTVGRMAQIATLDTAALKRLTDWLQSLRPQPTPRKAVVNVPTRGGTNYRDRLGRPIRNGNAYAKWSLNDEAGRVARVGVGGRATALNTAAFRMGQLAARGWIDYSTVETALLRASAGWQDADLSEQARSKMIRTGFTSGAGKATDRE